MSTFTPGGRQAFRDPFGVIPIDLGVQDAIDASIEERVLVSGDVFWVDSSTGDDSNGGTSPTDALATIDAAIGLTQASHGDIVAVMPGHAETVSAAAGINADVAGISIVGLGVGATKPTITFATDTAATFVIGAANVRVQGLRFVCNIASQVIMLDINSTYAIVEFNEFLEGSATGLTMIDVNGGGANACDNTRIRNNYFYAPTAGNYDRAIELGEVAAGVMITDNVIYGDFDDAGIHNPTGKVLTALRIRGNVITNLQSGQHAVELVSACTGSCSDNRLYGDTLNSILDPGSLTCANNTGAASADQMGMPLPAGFLTGLPPNYIAVTADMTSSTWNTVAAHEIATITGAVRIVILPQCTETITSAGGNATLILGDETTTNSIISSSDAEALAVGEWWVDATMTRTLITKTLINAVDLVIGNGKDIGYTIGTEALTDGSIVFHMFWEPLDATGNVAAGAGGVL